MLISHKFGFLLILFLISIASAKDDTLKKWATGKSVTEATLRKISKSSIFSPDSSFLLRLAYVESKFGEDSYTFREDYYGGIWQVEESVFEITQTSPSTLSTHYTAIQSHFNITWTSVKWKQLIIPLYSCLAAALYFTCVAGLESIPQTIPGQFEYWKTWYRPFGDFSKFENDSQWLQNQTKCRGKMDLCIVLDGSGSIGEEDYQLAKDFVATLISSFTLDYTRIGMVVFSSSPTTIFEINNSNSITQLATQAKSAIYPSSGTRTDLGINHAIEMFNSLSNATTNSTGVPKILMVFTDGQSNRESDMDGAVASIRNNHIISISIGIGPSINDQELLQIALNDQTSVFTVQDFTTLQYFLERITSVACEVPQTPSLNTKYDDVLEIQEKRFYHLRIPPEGITVNVTEINGKTNGYWSYTDEVPSEAVHDGVISNGLTYIPPPPTLSSGHPRAKRAVEELEIENVSNGVYIAIEGMEQMNNYTLSFVEGNKAGTKYDGSGAIVNTAAEYAILIFIFFCISFN